MSSVPCTRLCLPARHPSAVAWVRRAQARPLVRWRQSQGCGVCVVPLTRSVLLRVAAPPACGWGLPRSSWQRSPAHSRRWWVQLARAAGLRSQPAAAAAQATAAQRCLIVRLRPSRAAPAHLVCTPLSHATRASMCNDIPPCVTQVRGGHGAREAQSVRPTQRRSQLPGGLDLAGVRGSARRASGPHRAGPLLPPLLGSRVWGAVRAGEAGGWGCRRLRAHPVRPTHPRRSLKPLRSCACHLRRWCWQ